jgi:hypothetical protein
MFLQKPIFIILSIICPHRTFIQDHQRIKLKRPEPKANIINSMPPYQTEAQLPLSGHPLWKAQLPLSGHAIGTLNRQLSTTTLNSCK